MAKQKKLTQTILRSAQANAKREAKKQMKDAKRMEAVSSAMRAKAEADKAKASKAIVADRTLPIEYRLRHMSDAQKASYFEHEYKKMAFDKKVPIQIRAQYLKPQDLKSEIKNLSRAASSKDEMQGLLSVGERYGVKLSKADVGIKGGHKDLTELSSTSAVNRWAKQTQRNLEKLGIDVSLAQIKTREFRSEFKNPEALKDLNSIMGKTSKSALQTDKRAAKFLTNRLDKTGVEYAELGGGKVRAGKLGIHPEVLEKLRKERNKWNTDLSDADFINLVEAEYQKEYQRRKGIYERDIENAKRGFGGAAIAEAMNPDNKAFDELIDPQAILNNILVDESDVTAMLSILIQAVHKKIYGQISQDISARARIEQELRSCTPAEIRALFLAWQNSDFASPVQDYSSSGDGITNVAQVDDYQFILQIKGKNPEGVNVIAEGTNRIGGTTKGKTGTKRS